MRYVYVLYLVFLGLSCQNPKLKGGSSQLPLAKQGDTLRLGLGQQFRISTSSNSCCLSCWIDQGRGIDGFPEPAWLSYQSQEQDEADADCAGCTTTTWAVYQAKAPIVDSLVWISIPMGVFENPGIQCSELQAEHLEKGDRKVFFFDIK